MSLAGNQWQVSKPATSILKDIMMSENFSYEMYKIFIKNKDNEYKFSYLGEQHLEKLSKYSNSKHLSETIYVEMRSRIFNGLTRSNSFIVNEIKGIFELLMNCCKYTKLTLKRWLIKVI
jgi:hypothetical protein